MLSDIENKTCLTCGKSISGRSDKKYCNDQCRTAYSNYKRKRASYRYVRNINNALIINRRILESLIAANINKTTPDILRQMGFNLKYHTHTYQSKTGKVYYYCYDYGYLQIEIDKYLIVKSNA